jgi:hypothetical protein
MIKDIIKKLCCFHKWQTIRKSEKLVTKFAFPNYPTFPNSYVSIKNVPEVTYQVLNTTEVFECEKCGKHDTIYY